MADEEPKKPEQTEEYKDIMAALTYPEPTPEPPAPEPVPRQALAVSVLRFRVFNSPTDKQTFCCILLFIRRCHVLSPGVPLVSSRTISSRKETAPENIRQPAISSRQIICSSKVAEALYIASSVSSIVSNDGLISLTQKESPTRTVNNNRKRLNRFILMIIHT